VQQVLDGSWISLCLATCHLLIGGTDPAELARQAPKRIAHVLEQDTILTEEPRGEGPVADVWASADDLRSVLRGVRR
jgi:sugar phosphate isomerase/epimerase